MIKNTVLLFLLGAISCANLAERDLDESSSLEVLPTVKGKNSSSRQAIIVGANNTKAYLPLLKGKTVGVVANQTSVIFKPKGATHLVDSLLELKIKVKKVFAPEHGFRGQADAGEQIKDGLDRKTGLPLISLYGKNKKPTTEQLEDVEVMVFDIQDVGARFYTYISSLHYVMEACAEENIPLLVLDRPNPNGHYIDGPVLEMAHKSFVGMHPVPIVHGLTIGEYAQMINGEGWLNDSLTCDLTVIPVDNYTHQTPYELPITPSPNLPNAMSINLYPSLCLFEGTDISIGRGTNLQFQVIGSPHLKMKRYPFSFTPQSGPGAKFPKHEGELCHGLDLSTTRRLKALDLKWLLETYEAYKQQNIASQFFNSFFTKLAGTTHLKEQIISGKTVDEIRASWQKDLSSYRNMRQTYLLYPEHL